MATTDAATGCPCCPRATYAFRVPARYDDQIEALSAADRPYKKAKRLSECLEIMGRMCEDGHIDPDLFEVFVHREVYREYAERFLTPQQIDAVNPGAIPGLSSKR